MRSPSRLASRTFPMQLLSAAQTDLGLVRSENEDRLLCADDLRLYAVADGIGGLPGGAEAAELAVTTLLREARAAVERGAPLDLVAAANAANAQVVDLGRRFAPDTGLGTTLTVAHVEDDILKLINVGDSRCYLLREGRLSALTTDDTVEQEVLARRARGEKVRLDERYRNALTRCIGQPMPLDAVVHDHVLQPGDRVLLCSDGVCRCLHDSAIARRLGQPGDPSLALAGLVADALDQGGNDNITGILLDVLATE